MVHVAGCHLWARVPREPRRQYKEMTVMMTDPTTGQVKEEWSSRSQVMPGRNPSSRGSEDRAGSEQPEIRHEVNRLREIVASVGRGSWVIDSPSAQT